MPSTTTSASRGRGLDVAPAVAVLAQDVRGGQRVAGPERRVLDERRVRVQGAGDGEDGRQLLVLDRTRRAASSAASRVSAATAATGSPW